MSAIAIRRAIEADLNVMPTPRFIKAYGLSCAAWDEGDPEFIYFVAVPHVPMEKVLR